jgi:CrcB protein
VVKLLIVGVGGFIGAILRYIISGFVQTLSGSISFPYGTFAVNMLGCFAIGVLTYLVEARGVLSGEMRLFLLIGLLGSLTTFSTFSNETVTLIREQNMEYALFNIGLQVAAGIMLVWLGRIIAHIIWR